MISGTLTGKFDHSAIFAKKDDHFERNKTGFKGVPNDMKGVFEGLLQKNFKSFTKWLSTSKDDLKNKKSVLMCSSYLVENFFLVILRLRNLKKNDFKVNFS